MLHTLVDNVRGQQHESGRQQRQLERQRQQRQRQQQQQQDEQGNPVGQCRLEGARALRARLHDRSLKRYLHDNFGGTTAANEKGEGGLEQGTGVGRHHPGNDPDDASDSSRAVHAATRVIEGVHRVAQAAVLIERRKPQQDARKECGAGMGGALEEALRGGTLGRILDSTLQRGRQQGQGRAAAATATQRRRQQHSLQQRSQPQGRLQQGRGARGQQGGPAPHQAAALAVPQRMRRLAARQQLAAQAFEAN
jgi:hypothetical protein